jgi:hypothetical protein
MRAYATHTLSHAVSCAFANPNTSGAGGDAGTMSVYVATNDGEHVRVPVVCMQKLCSHSLLRCGA